MPTYEIGTVEALLGGLEAAEEAGLGQAAGESVQDWLARAQMERILQQAEAEATNSVPVYNWNYEAAKDFEQVVSQGEADLRGAWDQWQLEKAVSGQGAATQPPTIQTNPQTAFKPAEAAAGTGGTIGGILTMSLPAWVAAVAPLLGVAVGAGLYELSPEFWTKVSRTLLPFCYDDTQVMPAIVDKNGQVYVGKDAVDALKRLIEEEGIGQEESSTLDDPDLVGVNQPVPYGSSQYLSYGTDTENGKYYYQVISGAPFSAFYSWNGYFFPVFASLSPFRIKKFRIRQGSEVLTKYLTGTAGDYKGNRFYLADDTVGDINPAGAPITTGTDTPSYALEKVAKIILFGTSQGSGYPAGTTGWGGVAVDPDTLPQIDVYTDPESETGDPIPFIPVKLPDTPGQSLDPETDPDPTAQSTPDQIAPYTNPQTQPDQYPDGSESTDPEGQELDKDSPIPLPYPQSSGDTDPDVDPSQPSDDKPQKLVDIIPPIPDGIIPSPTMPTVPTGSLGVGGGLVSVYNPTAAELEAFTHWLWVTWQDATIDKIWNNPFDGVISLHELYATPITGARHYIKSGFLVSDVECDTVPTRYSEIDCGTVVFPEYYGNYLDYSPYSKCHCYLPFIGIVELNVDDIVGSAVNIKYRVDSYTGTCIAIIRCAKENFEATMYQFSGNCACEIPITGGSQASIKAGQLMANAQMSASQIAGIGGIVGGIASLLTGSIAGGVHGVAGGLSSEAYGRASAIQSTVSAKSTVQHSGQFGDTVGAMGNKKPFMIIRRPVQVVVPNYQQEYGFPAHKYVTIGSCTGFIRCRGVHVVSATATDEEKKLIEQMLMEGVFAS